jgi:hypothetical protein
MKISKLWWFFTFQIFTNCTTDDYYYHVPSHYYSMNEAKKGGTFISEYKIQQNRGKELNIKEVWFAKNIMKVRKKWIWQNPEIKTVESSSILIHLSKYTSDIDDIKIRLKGSGSSIGIFGRVDKGASFPIWYKEGETPPDTLELEVLKRLENSTEEVVGEFKIVRVDNGI